ncbi:hypothetical protein M0802_004619 [Mischocyttarus mexicanus]|nr:hypothetical protein M0802_004619 [Mischocyttarus mexicanus]
MMVVVVVVMVMVVVKLVQTISGLVGASKRQRGRKTGVAWDHPPSAKPIGRESMGGECENENLSVAGKRLFNALSVVTVIPILQRNNRFDRSVCGLRQGKPSTTVGPCHLRGPDSQQLTVPDFRLSDTAM